MKNQIRNLQAVVLVLILLTAATSAFAGDPQIMQLDPVVAGSCIAVRVPVGEGRAVSGLTWYNNDADVVFPQVLVAAGYDGLAPDMADALVLVENVQGAELGWSELAFGHSVMSPTEVFYVIFQLPEFTGEQSMGVGPGIGYEPARDESCVFVSAEGIEWIRMVTDKGLLVEPVYVDDGAKSRGATTAMLMLPEPGNRPAEEPEELPVRTELLAPYPNPFNPQVTVAYTLKDPSEVAIAVFDLRGRKVREIRPGLKQAGRHQEVWRGRDDAGRQQASGVYFIRLNAGSVEQTHRVMLIK
jgi:hypothetical protein